MISHVIYLHDYVMFYQDYEGGKPFKKKSGGSTGIGMGYRVAHSLLLLVESIFLIIAVVCYSFYASAACGGHRSSYCPILTTCCRTHALWRWLFLIQPYILARLSAFTFYVKHVLIACARAEVGRPRPCYDAHILS